VDILVKMTLKAIKKVSAKKKNARRKVISFLADPFVSAEERKCFENSAIGSIHDFCYFFL
jgi:hypothetical protein